MILSKQLFFKPKPFSGFDNYTTWILQTKVDVKKKKWYCEFLPDALHSNTSIHPTVILIFSTDQVRVFPTA